MALPSVASETGGSILPDTGTLFYNDVFWSALYSSKINGQVVPDNAKRTTKYVEYTLESEGVVTLNDGEVTTDASWANLRKKLSAHGGKLVYTGKGFSDLKVNVPGSPLFDVAYGPVPKIIYFQPLGSGRSANIKWQVTFHLPELIGGVKPRPQGTLQRTTPPQLSRTTAIPILPVLQFNYECSVSYDEEGYSTVNVRGTLEIPMTRATVSTRIPTDIVDAYRQAWLDIQFDLTRYRVVRRSFDFSRDKRTCEWEYSVEQHSPMGLPTSCTSARGTMSIRKASVGGKAGLPTVRWGVSLRATYTVRPDMPRRVAALAFYSLVWFRMNCSSNAKVPALASPDVEPQQPAPPPNPFDAQKFRAATAQLPANPIAFYTQIMGQAKAQAPPVNKEAAAIVTDFAVDEGLYEDGKTITFEASWVLTTTLSTLLAATGVWRFLPDVGGNAWALSMGDVSGWRGALINTVNRPVDLIVDLGGGAPLSGPPVTPSS